MIYTIFLALAFVSLGYYWYSKVKVIDVSMVLLLLYSFVAIMCVYELHLGSSDYRPVADLSTWDIRLWPYIYLFVLFILFLRPFMKYPSKGYVDKLYISPSMQKLLIVLSIIYVFAALISVYYSLSTFTYTFQQADFAEIYEEEVEQYANLIDGLAKRYTEYFRPIVFISSFYFIFKQRTHKTLFIIVLFVSIFCSLMINALNASRGGAFNLVMMIVVCMVMFWGSMIKREKKRIILSGFLIAAVFVGYSYLVTVARFEDNSSSSIYFYFGHSFLAFNYGIAGRIPSLSQGTYLFNYFLPVLGLQPIPTSPLRVEGLFITFIGSLYKDFGLIGTFIVAIIFPSIISLLIRPRKGRADIASLYLYLFYAWRLMSGVFVYGNAEGFLWFVAFLIFIFFRVLSNSSIRNNNNNI